LHKIVLAVRATYHQTPLSLQHKIDYNTPRQFTHLSDAFGHPQNCCRRVERYGVVSTGGGNNAIN